MSIAITIALLLLGYFIGQKLIEDKHFVELEKREKLFEHISIFSEKKVPENMHDTFLVKANIVISSDFFKDFLSLWGLIFGGRLISYETLLERARRKVILRVKEQANTKMLMLSIILN